MHCAQSPHHIAFERLCHPTTASGRHKHHDFEVHCVGMLSCRFVSSGDLIGLLVPAQQRVPAPQQQQQQQQQGALPHFDVAYFQVQAVAPEVPTPLAVNPASTHFVLQGGTARSLLPVGFKAFAASAAAAAAEGPPSKQSNSPLPGAQTTAAAEAEVAAAAAAASTSILGVHASAAAAASTPGLPGVPGPLTDTWRSVGAVLAPLLHPAAAAVDLAVALLLWGPRGSGRRTAARAAAAALGLNCIELSCHDLRVSHQSVMSMRLGV
jgi:hypothetical protein